METQIEIVKRIAPNLKKDLQDIQCRVLSQLEGKLKTASLHIEQLRGEQREVEKEIRKHDDHEIRRALKGIAEMKALKKAKYAVKKDTLYAILDDIEKWQARYDPTWILIMQMSIGTIDNQLEQEQGSQNIKHIPIIMAIKGIRSAGGISQSSNQEDLKPIWIKADDVTLDPISIPGSMVELSALASDEEEMVIIDTMACLPLNIDSTTKAVGRLARKLAEVDPATYGLLKCRGVIKFLTPDPIANFLGFKFIFNIPRHLSSPQSLRAVLLSGACYPLDERLALAKKLTSSILFVHSLRYVHKNIRPETIIIFRNDRSEIGAPFLAGFEQFRPEGGHTNLVGDDVWYHNLCMFPMIINAELYIC